MNTTNHTSPSGERGAEPMFDHRDVSDFLDCPFCGSRPSLHPVGNNYTKSRKLTVKCTGCRMQLTNAAIRNDFNWLRKNTAGDWNRRAASSTQPIGEDAANGAMERGLMEAWMQRAWGYVDDDTIGYKTALEVWLARAALTHAVPANEGSVFNAWLLDKYGIDALDTDIAKHMRAGWDARAALTAEKVAMALTDEQHNALKWAISQAARDYSGTHYRALTTLRKSLPAEKVAAEPKDWRVGLFFSSSNPRKQVRVLADGRARIEEYEKHRSFVRWIDDAAPQPAQSAEQDERAAFLSGRDVEELFLRWSEWTTELGEAISRKNIDGFVSDLRALLAAQPVSGGKS